MPGLVAHQLTEQARLMMMALAIHKTAIIRSALIQEMLISQLQDLPLIHPVRLLS